MGAARYRSPHPTQERSWDPACTTHTRTRRRPRPRVRVRPLDPGAPPPGAEVPRGQSVVTVAAACGGNGQLGLVCREHDVDDRGRFVVDDDATSTGSSTTPIPEETAGPFPGDGTNGPNVLTESGIVRSDIRSSFGVVERYGRGRPRDDQAHGARQRDGRRAGRRRRLPVALRPRRARTRCTRRAPPTRTTCAACRRPTTTVRSRSRASSRPRTRAGGRTSTSRCTRASPKRRAPAHRSRRRNSRCREDSCNLVYATDGYEQSVANLAQTSLDTDMVFSDGVLATDADGHGQRQRRHDRRAERAGLGERQQAPRRVRPRR